MRGDIARFLFSIAYMSIMAIYIVTFAFASSMAQLVIVIFEGICFILSGFYIIIQRRFFGGSKDAK